MNHLKKNGLIDFVNKFEDSIKHIMGVCLVMQLLKFKIVEFVSHQELGLISGNCKIFPSFKIKVSQIIWNINMHLTT